MKINKQFFIIILLMCSVICTSVLLNLFKNNSWNWRLYSSEFFTEQSQEMFVPSLYSLKITPHEKGNYFIDQAMNFMPAYNYNRNQTVDIQVLGDETTYEMIIDAEANCEVYVDEEGKLVGEVLEVEKVSPTIDLDKLQDPSDLISKYYVVDRTAAVDEDLFDVDTLMGMDMSLAKNVDGPQILIYHTHSQEAFVDSVPGDASTTIVGVGAYLTQLLEDSYGIDVMHHTKVYDLVDGKLDRSKAYDNAKGDVLEILENNPSIEMVIDLHRDGVNETTHLVTKINDKTTAQIMFFNGLSSTVSNGSISHLENPYIQENLALSFQMQLAANELFPGFTRRIYLKSYRYNMHMMPKSMLIEAGAQTNTVEEMKNAMEVLAEILVSVVK